MAAARRIGSARNPEGLGSHPFARTARCMLCYLGPEQTDHSHNIAHGLIEGDADLEFPSPYAVPDPACTFPEDGCMVPAPEPPARLSPWAGWCWPHIVTVALSSAASPAASSIDA